MKKILALLLVLVVTRSAIAGKSFSGRPISRPSSSSKTFSSSKSFSRKSYSGTSKSYSSTPKSYSAKPTSTVDTLGGKAQIKVESRQAFNKGNAPKTTYQAGNKTIAIDPKDTEIRNLRNKLSHEKWTNRDLRQQQTFGNYYSRPVVVYQDPYPSFFWWWLLDRSLDERALFAYHHQSTMDQQRLRDLYKDAELEARVRQLERQGVQKDPAYTPAGIEPDLMYSNDYVDAAYNPSPSIVSWWTVLKIILGLTGIVFVGWLIWYVFIRVIP